MLSFVAGLVVGAVVGAVVSFLALRKNPKIAAQANQVAAQTSAVVSAAEKKL